MDDPHIQPVPAGGTRYRVRLSQPVRRAHLLGPAALQQVPPGLSESSPVEAPPTEKTSAPAAAPEPAPVLDALSSVYQALVELEQRRQQSLDELQQVAIEMSVAIASRVLRQQVDAGASGIVQLVEEAMTRFAPVEPIRIHLHPEDLAQVRSVESSESAPQPPSPQVAQLVADETVARGDCEVRGEDHNYVARMELTLEEIRVDLMESLEDAQIERRRPAGAGSGLRRFPDRRETA